jgi:dTDP-4-dehydrorhamnose 3,5-epimerase
LSDVGPRQLYVAPGFAHGFCVLSEFADLHYKVSQLYDHSDESGLLWNDQDVGILWPIANPIVSSRDGTYLGLRQLDRSHLPQVALPS